MISATQLGIHEPESHLHRIWVLLPISLLAVACRDAAPTAPTSLLGEPIPVPLPVPLRMDLGTLGGPSSYANDINGDGTVVGTADNAAGVRRAFRWTPQGGMTDLGTLPGHDWSAACCITDDGQILGVSGSSSVSTTQATPVIWSPDGTITPLDIPLLPGAQFGGPSDFSGTGIVAGSDMFASQHAWIWSETQGKYDITANVPGGSFEGAAGEVDATGLVAGTSDERSAGCSPLRSRCWRAFLFSFETGYRSIGTPGDAPDAVVTGMGLGAGPTVVGSVSFPGGGGAYRWTESDGFTILPAASNSYATAVNSDGLTVGAAWDPALVAYQATAWPRSGGSIRLSPDDAKPQIATDVNDLGTVVGWAAQGNGTNHATVWLLGPVSQAFASSAPLKPAATATVQPVSPKAVGGAAAVNACASDLSTLVSRGALLACENR